MDSLLATYASDDDDGDLEQEQEQEQGEEEKPILPRKPSLFGRLPPPRNSGAEPSSGSLFASLPAPQFEAAPVKLREGDGAVQNPRSSFFSNLPPPKVEESGTGHGNPKCSLFAALPPPKVEEFGMGNGNPKSSLFAALPLPKVEFDSSKVKVEVSYGSTGKSNSKVKKHAVAFKPPIDVSVLEDDDDDWRPAQKKAKAEPSAVAKSGGGLQSLLPAPKNSLGLGSTLGAGPASGGRRAAMEVVARSGTQDVKTEPAGVNPRISTPSAAPAKEAHASQGQVQYDNSAYAVDESAAFVPQVPYSNEPYGWTAPQGGYAPAQEMPQSMHSVNNHYEQQNRQYSGNASSYASHSSEASYAPANSAPVNDPVAQVLQAERRRGREDKTAAPTVIEVKQADLTGGKVREDQLRPTGIAFGPSYQPVSSSKDKQSKIQRRKHQIGTLLHDMKAREMELLDRRTKGSLTKAETQAKYGW